MLWWNLRMVVSLRSALEAVIREQERLSGDSSGYDVRCISSLLKSDENIQPNLFRRPVKP